MKGTIPSQQFQESISNWTEKVKYLNSSNKMRKY